MPGKKKKPGSHSRGHFQLQVSRLGVFSQTNDLIDLGSRPVAIYGRLESPNALRINVVGIATR